MEGYTLFETALGSCGIAWSKGGITCIQLPEATPRETARRLRERTQRSAATAPPSWVQEATDRIIRHLAGEVQNLSDLPLDMAKLGTFDRTVYEATRAIESGSSITYGGLARRIGAPGAARAIGQALARNPYALAVPCHRILAADGQMRGFSAHGGVALKTRLLALEGHKPGSLFEGAGELPFDPAAAVRSLVRADRALGQLIKRVGAFRLKLEVMKSPYEALAEAIVYQQLTGKAAATILDRVRALFEHRFPGPEDLLATPEDPLRAAGLSRAKVAALHDLATRTLRGTVPTLAVLGRMDDEEIIERLTTIRGVGRWTVEMLLIFRLGRPDVLPANDYGLRKGFGLAFETRNFPTPNDVIRRGERWRPFRTVASWYLWRALELPAPQG